MKKNKVVVQPQHYSQYVIEGGEIFALEGMLLGVAGGWWLCHSTDWHWLAGPAAGISILAVFMWLLSKRITRLVVLGLNALGGGLLSYLVATALFRASELTGAFVGLVVAVAIGAVLHRRFALFRHDLTHYRQLKEEQTNRGKKDNALFD